MYSPIPSPDTKHILTPLLSALPAAAVSPAPPESLLPYLSPILRQRVQLLSATSPPSSTLTEPWLPLLCYNTNPKKVKRLTEIAKFHAGLEAHPVSGEVELDWGDGVVVLFKRVDEETLQAGVELGELGLWVRLVWCTGDAQGDGGPNGWRIGEVSVVPDGEDLATGKGDVSGYETIGEAEGKWRGEAVRDAVRKSSDVTNGLSIGVNGNGATSHHAEEEDKEEEEDDDDYWAQYDNTPAQTPGPKRSPAPRTMTSYTNGLDTGSANTDEDSYYAQYATVQPALDNHDPDEADQSGNIESTLDGTSTQSLLPTPPYQSSSPTSNPQTAYKDHQPHPPQNDENSNPNTRFQTLQTSATSRQEHLEHPRPASSTSSAGSSAVRELERKVELTRRQDNMELAVRQHISSSLKSLWRLGRGVGMDMEEFGRVVGMEVELLGMLEGQEEG